MIPNSLKKFFAVGSGVGIEIAGPRGSETLRVSAVRVRPNGAKTLGGFSIENAAQQPAAEWGQAYAAFLKKLGLKHVVAAVLLPREDVILRQISVPGVSDKDLPAAVGFQMDGLHPYDENDVVSSWARLPGTSMVMVAIARRAALERYTAWFSEAGVKVGSFTCAPAAIYSARRLFAPEPLPAVLAMEEVNGRMELYGESPSRPLFSASFDATPERATTLACAELRLDPLTETRSFHALVGASPALPYAAALAAACPRLFLPINLLPTELRSSNSRALWIPTAVAAGLVLIAAVALAAYPSIEDRRYLKTLNDNIAQVKPQAMLAAAQQSGMFIFIDTDLKVDLPQSVIEIDRDKTAQLGLNMTQVGNALGSLLGGNYTNYFSMDTRSYKVIPQVERVSRLNVDQLMNYPVANIGGVPVLLSTIATIRPVTVPETLNHFQQLNSATLSGVMMPGVSLADALKYLQDLAARTLPQGYSIDYGGQGRQFVQESGGIMTTFAFAIIIVFLALAALFESFRDPLVILISVPLSIAGALIFIALGVGGATINIYTEVGLVTLMGLISKHGILIVEVANTEQQTGKSKYAAIVAAAGTRLRPILMTTAAMVLGVVPLVFASGAGAASRFAIGLVISTGLAIGTVFTLFVVPGVYMLIGATHARESAEGSLAELA